MYNTDAGVPLMAGRCHMRNQIFKTTGGAHAGFVVTLHIVTYGCTGSPDGTEGVRGGGLVLPEDGPRKGKRKMNSFKSRTGGALAFVRARSHTRRGHRHTVAERRVSYLRRDPQ